MNFSENYEDVEKVGVDVGKEWDNMEPLEHRSGKQGPVYSLYAKYSVKC
jgi:hypothetical protein